MSGETSMPERSPGRDAPASAARRWRRLLAVRGMGAGVFGGLCCLVGAVAVGLGLGGASFFGSFMGRYQRYFMATSVALMGVWIVRTISRARAVGGGRRAVLNRIVRPVGVMGVGWVLGLAVALAAGRAAGLG